VQAQPGDAASARMVEAFGAARWAAAMPVEAVVDRLFTAIAAGAAVAVAP
jgi:hypothetical protein